MGEGDFDIDDKFEIIISEILPDDEVVRYRIKDTGIWLREDILDNLMKIEEIPTYIDEIDDILDIPKSEQNVDWAIIQGLASLPEDVLYQLFNENKLKDIIVNYSYSEVERKVLDYFENEVLQIGDIVCFKDDGRKKYVVLGLNGIGYTKLLDADGVVCTVQKMSELLRIDKSTVYDKLIEELK